MLPYDPSTRLLTPESVRVGFMIATDVAQLGGPYFVVTKVRDDGFTFVIEVDITAEDGGLPLRLDVRVPRGGRVRLVVDQIKEGAA